jgi:hypothetical protein
MSRPTSFLEVSRRRVILAARRWVQWYQGPVPETPAADVAAMEKVRDELISSVLLLRGAEKAASSARPRVLPPRRVVNPALPTMKRVMGSKPRRKRVPRA